MFKFRSMQSGLDRFILDYKAYPHQKAFHESTARHRLLGGAAGPGKTFALIMDHMLVCNSFPKETAPQVHTLLLRRTYPKLESTVITRFREKVPPELYKDFNETKGVVTWHNGSTTKFGAMQYEHDVWGYQGQWLKIAYDELTEFTFKQFQNITAWNRCPVSTKATKDGATNPIGIGARWVEDLFVKKTPCDEMDKSQKAMYRPEQFSYFAATYLDNPIYAKDESYIAGLDSYQGPVAKALKLGIWGVSGGYFDGAWDEAENTYAADSHVIQPWHKKWLGGDWGFEHNFALYWLTMDDLGVVRCYRELVDNHHTPEELAERIEAESQPDRDEFGQLNYQLFSFAHDAFARKQDINTIALRMGKSLTNKGFPGLTESTKDKKGREQIIYDMLKQRVKTGEIFNDELRTTEPVHVAKLQIADTCHHLLRVLPGAPRDEDNVEEIAEFLGDDPIPGLGYPLYAMFGNPNRKPLNVRIAERMEPITDPQSRFMHLQRITAEEKRKTNQSFPIKRRFGFRR